MSQRRTTAPLAISAAIHALLLWWVPAPDPTGYGSPGSNESQPTLLERVGFPVPDTRASAEASDRSTAAPRDKASAAAQAAAEASGREAATLARDEGSALAFTAPQAAPDAPVDDAQSANAFAAPDDNDDDNDNDDNDDNDDDAPPNEPATTLAADATRDAAVSDAAAAQPADPAVEEMASTDVTEPPTPPEPEPEPPTPPDLLPFLWTDEAHGVPPPHTEAIGRFDTLAETRTRPDVTQPDPGPTLDGVASKVLGTAAPVQALPDEVPRPPVPKERTPPVPRAAKKEAAPGAPGQQQRATAANAAQMRRGAAARETAASLAARAVQLNTTWRSEIEQPHWWRPAAARIDPAAAVVATPAVAPGRLVATPPTRPRAATTAIRDVADPEEIEGSEQPEPVEEEVVADASGHPNPERPTEPFAPSRSPQASFDEAADVREVQASARSTPLGEWVHQVNSVLRRLWVTGGTDIESRAFGSSGDVVVRFVVTRRGRVQDVQVAQTSGITSLDALARLSIPHRLPRPPEGDVAHVVRFKLR